MSQLRVRCQPRGSTRWVYLDALGDVSGLKYSRVWRPEGGYSGPHMMSCRWAHDPSITPGFMRRGARVEVVDDGDVVWGGLMAEPRRGTPHELTAYGLGREASGRVSVVEYESPTELLGYYQPSWVPNDVVDHAIEARGLPWVRLGDLGAAVTPTDSEKDPLYIDQLLDRAAAGQGAVWHVDEQGIVRMAQSIGDVYGPKPPVGLLPGDDVRMGTSDPQYVSAIYGYFVFDPPPSGGPTYPVGVLAEDEAASARWGVQEEWIDYQAWGTQTSPTNVMVDVGERLGLVGARMQFTDSVTGDAESLRILGFGPARVTSLREGMTLRIFDALDSTGTLHLGGSTDVTIGEVEVDADTMTATLKPVGFTGRDFQSALADPDGPRATGNRDRTVTQA